MSIRNGLLALGALTLGFSACSGGGGGGAASSGLLQEQPPLSSGATSQTATRTYQIGSGAGSYDLPPLGGFGGSLELPATSVPANTRLELTSSLQAPAGAPMLQNAERRPQDTGTLDVYFYTTIRLTSTVEFPTLPGFSVTLPATVKPAGLQFFYAISSPKPTNGAQAQFRTEGPASVADQTITFVPSTTPLTLQAGQPYVVALYAISAIAAKAGATKIYVVNNGTFNGNTGGASVATFDAAGNPALPTITAGLNVPDAIAVDAAGKIYVVNEGDRTLVTFAPDGTPSTPTIVEPLGNPFDVAVDAAGKIYLMDFGAGTLLTYKPDGTPTTPVLDGIFNYPAGVAVDAAGKIYVADSERGEYGQVKTFAPDGSPTTPTIGFGRSAPYAVAVDGAGKIYATDTTTNTLTTYAPDGSRTTPTIGALDNPVAVAVDAAGKIYVANANSDTVTAYNPDGTPSTPTITGLHYPMGIAVH
jgi:sugar lactone lactonase YvrE